MFHRHQKTNFRVSEFSLSGGYLHSLLNAKYTHINIGELFEYLADQLWHTVGTKTDRVDFTLINVCSPFTRYSHGSQSEPPTFSRPRGKGLIFTFAIRNAQHYSTFRFNPRNVRRNSNSLTKWGFNMDCNNFVSISVDMVQGEDWGTNSSRANELEYIYNLIGPMTKSLMRRQTQYETSDRDYADAHEKRSLHDWYSELYRMPLKQMFLQVPYHLWAFNYHIWEYAPNVIPQRTITPQVATYFFMYLNDSVAKEPKRSGDVTMKRLGLMKNDMGNALNDSGIAGILASSLIAFIQRIRSSDGNDLSDLELLAPAVLSQFLNQGNTQIPNGYGYRIEMAVANNSLISDLRSREKDLGYLFMPPKEVAANILRQDQNWRQTINSAMKFPQTDLTVRSDL